MVTHNVGQYISFKNKGIWIFVGLDLAIFGLFFLVFLIERSASKELFLTSQTHLNARFGFTNTLVLIASSWLLVESIRLLKTNLLLARRFLLVSILCGCLFCALKGVEYSQKFDAGIFINENTFYTFYYILTFIHLVHVIAGLVTLVVIYRWTFTRKAVDFHSFTESVGIFWHMVDLLWVFLFLLLYLLG